MFSIIKEKKILLSKQTGRVDSNMILFEHHNITLAGRLAAFTNFSYSERLVWKLNTLIRNKMTGK